MESFTNGRDDGPHVSSETPAITLYRLHACPYCERVVNVLNEHEVAYTSRFVEPLHSHRNVVQRVAGTRSVPVIVDERTGVMMPESGHIVDYVQKTYADNAANPDGGPG